MAIERTAVCDCCGASAKEPVVNGGWPGWGGVHGVILNGVANPSLCPSCLGSVMQFIEERKNDLDSK